MSVQEHFLSELFELLADEKISVRVKAMKALTAALPSLTMDSLKRTVMPVILKYMQPRELDPNMQHCLGSLLGRIVVEVSAFTEARLFLKAFSYRGAFGRTSTVTRFSLAIDFLHPENSTNCDSTVRDSFQPCFTSQGISSIRPISMTPSSNWQRTHTKTFAPSLLHRSPKCFSI